MTPWRMRILAFVDVHGSKAALKKLREKAQKADLLICAGDVSIFEHGMSAIVEELDRFGKPLLIVHGNHESESSLRKACKGSKNILWLHDQLVLVENFAFFGHGGGGFSLEDKEFEASAKVWLGKIPSGKKFVFVTHAPAHKTALDALADDHVGNKSYREFILATKPLVHICGHLHENAGKHDQIGKTLSINPGPLGKFIRVN